MDTDTSLRARADDSFSAGGFSVDILVQGYPGKTVCHGGLGWSTVATIPVHRGNENGLLGITLDPDRRQARVRGDLVELTKQEFDILYLLASRRGIVFSRAALIAKVWGDDTYVTERTVDSVVSRLRRKIERDPNDPEMILTAWGVGYKFVAADEDVGDQRA